MLGNMFGLVAPDLAIDLGTANTLIHVKGRGIVLDEPSVVAYVNEGGRKVVYAVGTEAKTMLGKTHRNMEVIRPLRDGVIADFDVAEEMIKQFIRKVLPRPALISPADRHLRADGRDPGRAPHHPGKRASLRRAPREADRRAGRGRARRWPADRRSVRLHGRRYRRRNDRNRRALARRPRLVALAARSRRQDGRSHHPIPAPPREPDDRRLHRRAHQEGNRHRQGAGRTARACPCPSRAATTFRACRRKSPSTKPWWPKRLAEPVTRIVDAVRQAFEQMPPELAADIYDHGLMMTGGGALLRNLDTVLQERISIRVSVADDPLRCVVKGCGIALDTINSSEARRLADRRSLSVSARDREAGRTWPDAGALCGARARVEGSPPGVLLADRAGRRRRRADRRADDQLARRASGAANRRRRRRRGGARRDRPRARRRGLLRPHRRAVGRERPHRAARAREPRTAGLARTGRTPGRAQRALRSAAAHAGGRLRRRRRHRELHRRTARAGFRRPVHPHARRQCRRAITACASATSPSTRTA